jgi:hypothetical protein
MQNRPSYIRLLFACEDGPIIPTHCAGAGILGSFCPIEGILFLGLFQATRQAGLVLRLQATVEARRPSRYGCLVNTGQSRDGPDRSSDCLCGAREDSFGVLSLRVLLFSSHTSGRCTSGAARLGAQSIRADGMRGRTRPNDRAHPGNRRRPADGIPLRPSDVATAGQIHRSPVRLRKCGSPRSKYAPSQSA